MLCESWTSRKLEKGVDPYGLGRWSYFILRGKGDKKIALITAYRVSTDLARPMTSTMQEFRKISQNMVNTEMQDRPRPRCQFILDLQAWIGDLTQKGCDMILSLDATEEYSSTGGEFTPIEYKDGNHIKHSSHDGTISTLCKTCGLQDPFTTLHTHSTPPPSYIRGKSRLDYIFVSASILHAIEQAGILPYSSMLIGDHRPCFLDFSTDSLFNDQSYPIAPLSRCGLQLYDPRKAGTYQDNLHKQFAYHHVEQRVQQLYDKVHKSKWTDNTTLDYEKLDQCVTECMLYAEKQTSPVVSTKFDWSPTLAKSTRMVCFWEHCQK